MKISTDWETCSWTDWSRKNQEDTKYQNQEWREYLVLILQNLDWYLDTLGETKLDTLGEMDRVLEIDRLPKLTQEWKVWMDL